MLVWCCLRYAAAPSPDCARARAPGDELALFATTLAEDEAMLRAGGLSVRLEAAVLFRAERKRLLHAARDAVAIYATATARVAAKAAAAA